MPKLKRTPQEFEARLKELAIAEGVHPDKLDDLEQTNLIMIQTMYPRDEMFRLLTQLFLVTFSAIRHSNPLLSTLAEFLGDLAKGANALKGDDDA